jgi:hypothetical protein
MIYVFVARFAAGLGSRICRSSSRSDTLWSAAIRWGYGACSRCACKAFDGNGQVCENCGHKYADHW